MPSSASLALSAPDDRLPETRDAHLRRVRVGRLLEATPAVTVASLAATLGIVCVADPHGPVLWWVGLLVGLTGLRCMACQCWRRGGECQQSRSAWLCGLSALALAAGLAWGALPMVLAAVGHAVPIGFGLFLLAGLGAVGVGGLAAHFPAYALFVGGMASSESLALWLDARASVLPGVVLVVLLAGLLGLGRSRARRIERDLALELARFDALREARAARYASERALARLRDQSDVLLGRLRVPLHSMVGYAELGRGRCGETAARRYFERIGQSGSEVVQLVESLQQLTREPSTGTMAGQGADDGREGGCAAQAEQQGAESPVGPVADAAPEHEPGRHRG